MLQWYFRESMIGVVAGSLIDGPIDFGLGFHGGMSRGAVNETEFFHLRRPTHSCPRPID